MNISALTRTELRELRNRISDAERRTRTELRELRELLEDIDEAYYLRGLADTEDELLALYGLSRRGGRESGGS